MSEYRVPLSNNSALDALAAGDVATSLEALREQLWRDPSYKSLVNLAVAERASGHFVDAVEHLMRAIRVNHLSPVAWFNWANIETDKGNFDYALELYTQAYVLDPLRTQKITLGFAQALLRERRFPEGWPLWEEGRLCQSWHPFPGTVPWHPSLKPGRILVICEGGYGDAFLFSRWLPFIKESSSASEVTLMIWQCLKDWTDWTRLGVDRVVAKEDDHEAGRYDYTTSWMSLPALAEMRSMDDLPWPDAWTGICLGSLRRSNRPLQIGFCWQSEQSGDIRKTKKLSNTEAQAIAKKLAAIGRVHGLVPGESIVPWTSKDLIAHAGWAGTTRIIQSLDYVVTVDTAVAHLSALCGVPTLILLPCASGWQWGRDTRVDSWYGPHVWYFRNRDPLTWDLKGIQDAVEESLCLI